MKNDKRIEVQKLIDLYIRGQLTQDEIDELWMKFLQNPEYYELFETELHLRGLINKGEKPGFSAEDEQNESSKPNVSGNIRSLKTWIIAAAASVLLAAGLQLFSLSENDSTRGWAISSIDLTEMTGADILRSDDEDVSDLDVSINEALSAAYNEEFDEAITKFNQLLDQEPSSRQQARIMLNLGILHYNQAEYELAKTLFESVANLQEIESHFEEKAWWFLGNTQLNLMELQQAREAVFNAYSMDGRYQKPALSLLKKLDVRLGYVPPDELD